MDEEFALRYPPCRMMKPYGPDIAPLPGLSIKTEPGLAIKTEPGVAVTTEFPEPLRAKDTPVASAAVAREGEGEAGLRQCVHCGAILDPAGLRQHVRVGAGEPAFLCEGCYAPFRTKCQYEEHVKAVCHVVSVKFPQWKAMPPPKARKRKYTPRRKAPVVSKPATSTQPDSSVDSKAAAAVQLTPATSTTESEVKDDAQARPAPARQDKGPARKDRGFRMCRDKRNKAYYECDKCGKRTTYASNMLAHIRMHTGERPFMCAVCARRFAYKSNLCKHLRRMHSACYAKKPCT